MFKPVLYLEPSWLEKCVKLRWATDGKVAEAVCFWEVWSLVFSAILVLEYQGVIDKTGLNEASSMSPEGRALLLINKILSKSLAL